MANKKIRKMVILAKPETTRGIDAAPTGANAIIVANNINAIAFLGRFFSS